MAQATWEKSSAAVDQLQQGKNNANRLKFMVGGVLILISAALAINRLRWARRRPPAQQNSANWSSRTPAPAGIPAS